MARWKARVEFLLSVIELLFLSLAVEALQGKMCQNWLRSGGVGHLEPRFQGKGSSPCQYIDTTRKAIDCVTTLPLKGSSLGNFLVSTKLDTFCYPTVQTAPCYVLSFWHNAGTDGIAVVSTALAMRALRRAVKIEALKMFSNVTDVLFLSTTRDAYRTTRGCCYTNNSFSKQLLAPVDILTIIKAL